jgi:uncharacterized protein YdeI (YjbR/CyaY-like superfamily)
VPRHRDPRDGERPNSEETAENAKTAKQKIFSAITRLTGPSITINEWRWSRQSGFKNLYRQDRARRFDLLHPSQREVTPPADLLQALNAKSGALERWRELSYSHQREHVEAIEEAKKPETRSRRIEGALRMVHGAAKKRQA